MDEYKRLINQYKEIHKAFKKELSKERKRNTTERRMVREEWEINECWGESQRFKKVKTRQQVVLTDEEGEKIQR